MSTQAVFGRRKEPHTIIIARGDKLQHFTIRPWMAAVAGSVFAAMAVGYLLGTSYLMLRDDILNAAVARQARMQFAYEDRIAALRSQVDRITSYRLLDQQIMETKVTELLNRQNVLAERNGRLAPLLDKARLSGVGQSAAMDPTRIPIPAAVDTAGKTPRTLFRPQQPVGAAIVGAGKSARLSPTPGSTDSPETGTVDRPLLTLSRLGKSLGALEGRQLDQLAALADSAREKRHQILRDAREAGLRVQTGSPENTGTGGPFIPVEAADAKPFAQQFEHRLRALNLELSALDRLRDEIRSFPIANPVPGREITSGFGKRKDPIIGRTAFHAGIDFSTPVGMPILATGSGTVVFAGRKGGYGKMVEIKHKGGLRTRYAHLSRISVKKGQSVSTREKLGEAGSTGRSTGPHLHYEVREGKTAVNPMTYLKAGSRLNRHL